MLISSCTSAACMHACVRACKARSRDPKRKLRRSLDTSVPTTNVFMMLRQNTHARSPPEPVSGIKHHQHTKKTLRARANKANTNLSSSRVCVYVSFPKYDCLRSGQLWRERERCRADRAKGICAHRTFGGCARRCACQTAPEAYLGRGLQFMKHVPLVTIISSQILRIALMETF